MEKLFSSLIESLINAFTGGFLADTFHWASSKLLEVGFNVPASLESIGSSMDNVGRIVLVLAISLIILKFIMKGFNTYVLWVDDNADSDPFNTLVNFAKAIILCLCFGVLYDMIADVAVGFGNQLLDAIVMAGRENQSLISALISAITAMITGDTMVTLIFVLIYIILYVILYLKIIMMGLELWVLKVGIPLACIGILDSSQDLWKSFMNKFWQICLTIIIQVFLQYFSVILLINDLLLFSIATMVLAMTTPKMLRDFMVPGNNLSMNAILHNTQMIGRGISMLAGKGRG